MKINLYKPHLALQQFVLNLSTIEVTLPAGLEGAVAPYPPTPFQSIIFYCNHPISMGRETKCFDKQPDTVLLGPQFSRVNIKVAEQLRAIRVDFLPGAMYRLLGIAMHELFDGGFDARDFFGAEMDSINEQLRNTASLEQGKSIVERFLLNRINRIKEIRPVDVALYNLLKNDGSISMDKTASLACMSLRQFERQCKERIGMSPKLYARILRFSKAYRLHEACPHLSWMEIAHEANYYDQMHLIRDFKTFAGVNPSVIEQQLLKTSLRMQKDLSY